MTIWTRWIPCNFLIIIIIINLITKQRDVSFDYASIHKSQLWKKNTKYHLFQFLIPYPLYIKNSTRFSRKTTYIIFSCKIFTKNQLRVSWLPTLFPFNTISFLSPNPSKSLIKVFRYLDIFALKWCLQPAMNIFSVNHRFRSLFKHYVRNVKCL